MNKIFLDTNVLLRFFLKQGDHQYKSSLALVSKIENGELKPYTSTIVLLELNYVGSKIYKIPDSEIMFWFEAICEMRNMTLIERTDLGKALTFYKKYKIKLGDCFIASQIPKDTILVTFDKELGKIKEIQVQTPEDVIK